MMPHRLRNDVTIETVAPTEAQVNLKIDASERFGVNYTGRILNVVPILNVYTNFLLMKIHLH